MHLFDIKFPVYSITKSHFKIWEEFNILYIKTYSGTYILDNKNLLGDTLGKRRVKVKNKNMLYIPKHTYYNMSQLVNSREKFFIDSIGKWFKWEKTKYVPLKYHKVIRVQHLGEGEGYVLHLKDINFPQKVNSLLAYSVKYVGVLHTDYGYLLYNYSEVKKKDTRRKL